MQPSVVTSFLVLIISQITATRGFFHQVCFFFPCIFTLWIMDNIYLCGASCGCWIGKLCGLAQLPSVYKPFQQQLNTWMLCVSKRKRKEGIEHRLCCTTQRLAQGLECWIRIVGVRVVQLKLHKETGFSCPKLLPWLELMYLSGV